MIHIKIHTFLKYGWWASLYRHIYLIISFVFIKLMSCTLVSMNPTHQKGGMKLHIIKCTI